MKLVLSGKTLKLFLYRNTHQYYTDYLLYLYLFVYLGPVSMKLQTSGKTTFTIYSRTKYIYRGHSASCSILRMLNVHLFYYCCESTEFILPDHKCFYLQPICCDQSVPESHDSSDPHSVCPGTVPARPAGRIYSTPRLPLEITGIYNVH